MREFNYKRAHKEWALPEWNKLDENFKRLFRMVQEHCAGQHQNKNLGMDWPFDEFKEAFDEAAKNTPAMLAHSGYVIYGLGHWDYKGAGEWPRDSHGGYWKYEHFVKQALAARSYSYASFKPYDTEKGWMMDHKEGTDYDNDELADMFRPRLADHFEVLDVRNVNFRVRGAAKHDGHPFCIGNAHMQNSVGMYLDPRSAPCAQCKLPYDDHESDRVMILRRTGKYLPQYELTEDEKAALEAIKEDLEVHKVDGFVFVPAEHGQVEDGA